MPAECYASEMDFGRAGGWLGRRAIAEKSTVSRSPVYD